MGHERRHQVRATGGQAAIDRPLLSPIRQLFALALLLLQLPRHDDEQYPQTRRDSLLQLELAIDPRPASTSPTSSSPTSSGAAYDSYIRGFATAAKSWGHPFFLRFNWEMNGNWFPWSEGVNGNKTGRVRRRLAPRARHLHRSRRDQRDLGLVPERRSRTSSSRASARSTPATPTSTGPASTATTGAQTRRDPTAGRTFDQLYNSTYNRSPARSRPPSR